MSGAQRRGRSQVIRSREDFLATQQLRSRARSLVRDVVVHALSIGRSIGRSGGWVRFPFYHHVFPDERRGFERHLDYLAGFGDFITLDQAVGMLREGNGIEGRFFCLTFDDGLRSCYDGALPILVDRSAPCAFFVVTDYVAETAADRVCRPLHSEVQYSHEYLTWPECAEMVRAGMTIGSHTCSHARLRSLTEQEALHQLIESKCAVEVHLGVQCLHFACPWGHPGVDVDLERDPALAERAGYASLVTTQRGANRQGACVFRLRRDQLQANWSTAQLRYFLSL